ncbi:MAG: nucleotidyltransferase domain-containing protein [Planctomycetota bacterium]|nr:nucleotidyltransferase domain-containing protein [Planctomycetota bacterium]
MTIDPARRAFIEKSLKELSEKENISILLAIESGSRAWGFPSPDSDYDVRFIFSRHSDDYLSVYEKRDVIEQPLEGDMDIGGWDLKKALSLTLKQNAGILEWLQSPHTYMEEIGFREDLLSFADSARKRISFVNHYRAMAKRFYEGEIRGQIEMKLKKYCYVLRPALALRWFRIHKDQSRVPMTMSGLLEETESPAKISLLIWEMIEKKARMDENAMSPRYPVLDEFIEYELEHYEESLVETGNNLDNPQEQANLLFRRWIADLL